ncbi:unannotated protein [freshwater metagenome]|uniref:Unannotated protein n=1 Tax=freshwater metagenome TaxID=449393 RepID=A0A6J6QE89_9ZZZZ
MARVLGLRERGTEHLGGDAVELGVELQGRDELARAGDLEVHVTERVLGAEDVGQGDVLRGAVDLVGDQAHRDAGDGSAKRDAGLQQRQRGGADRAHRGGAVGAHRLGELTDRVGELLARRQHGQQRTARERTVADLAALGRAHAAGLAGRERREDVLVHVAARLLRGESVELLLQLEHVERGDTQDLGLAALEERRAVHARDHADLGVQRADVGQAATVHADLVAQDALAHDLLADRAERRADLLLATLELAGELVEHRCLDLIGLGLALELVDDNQRGGDVALRGGLDGGVHVVLVVEEDRELLHRLGGDVGQLLLGLAQLLDEGLGGVEATGHDLLGRRLDAVLDQGPGLLGGLGLDHHDRDVAGLGHPASDDHVEHGLLELAVRREGDPLAVDEGDTHATDRAGERQAGELGRERRGVDRQHVVGSVGVERHHGDDDLDLVAQALLERRAQRPVDQAAGEDRVLARTTLAAEERAGDLARGVHPLLDVDRQGEEVEVVLGVLAGRGGREQHRVVVEVRRHGAGRLAGQQAGLELDGAGAELAVVEHGLDGGDHGLSRVVLSQGVSLFCRGAIRGVPL